jgi:hypothetical protein
MKAAQNTEFTIESKELYVSPMKDRNEEKHGLHGNQCICCGQLMRDDEKLYVHMGTDWLAYNVFEEEIIDNIPYIKGTKQITQGCFPIGNTCAKKMKGFTFSM